MDENNTSLETLGNVYDKLALSKDFYETKIFVEKIGTNRRMLDRKILFDFHLPFDLVPKYKGFGEASEQTNSPKKSESQFWSGMADLNRRPQRPERCALAI